MSGYFVMRDPQERKAVKHALGVSNPTVLCQQSESSYVDDEKDYLSIVPSPSLSLPPSSDVMVVQPHILRTLNTRTHSRLRGSRGKSTVRAPLSYYAKANGAANTAFATLFYLQPNLDSSWSDWQGVFDEVRVLSAELHWNVWFSTLPSAFAAQTPNAAVAFDPSGSIGITAVNQVMDYEEFQLLNVGANAAGTYATSPQALSKGGHMVFKAHVPKGPLQSLVETVQSAGVWRPTEDASNYQWGGFGTFVAAGGTTSVLQIECFVRMECEFRVRR